MSNFDIENEILKEYKGKDSNVIIPGGITKINDAAFFNCNSLTSVTIPGSVTSIGDDAFHNCSNLTSVTIPDSVTSIGSYAFCGCKRLTNITIPGRVTFIGSCAFADCSGLESMTVSENNEKYHSSGNCIIETESKTLVSGCKNSIIPNNGSVTSISEYAFCGCENLISITIPNSVTSIGNYAFLGCYSLTNITIPDSVTSIGEDVFFDRSGFSPDKVKSLESVFFNCSNLTIVTTEGSYAIQYAKDHNIKYKA